MCGIFCSISRHGHSSPSDSAQHLLHARGPDAARRVFFTSGAQPVPDAYLTCHSTVLSLRGVVTVEQPYQTTGSSSTLCWNGEAWAVGGQRVEGNDTAAIFSLLTAATEKQISPMDAREENLCAVRAVSEALAVVAGPYAFVFYDEANSRVYFGRDFLGRRSLLWRVSAAGDIFLCSIPDGDTSSGWTEVEADGIYCVDLLRRAYSRDVTDDCLLTWGDFVVSKAPYTHSANSVSGIVSVIPELLLCRDIPATPKSLDATSPSVSSLQHLLTDSMRLRVSDIPEPPILSQSMPEVRPAKLAILFSGGLDCTTIARLAHDLLPGSEPIELLNVAFENPRVHKSGPEGAYELCPDRITGRASHNELSRVCPGRDWRFVAINVPYTETQEHRQRVIALIHPHNTEMDLSIACALYFAARGHGLIALRSGDVVAYASSARVLLSGLGADELFAGYTRHATAFKRNGYVGLLDELDLDVGRLGKRNLGRDDRVTSNWGREVRYPFLDENLVRWSLGIPVTEKCDFGAAECPDGSSERNAVMLIEPGKKILRCLAWALGMKYVAKEKKRAVSETGCATVRQ